jgi:uncharacterized protein (TIGR02001 family)
MNLLKRGAWVIGMLAVAGAAQAQFSSTVTGTSDYDFRGYSQTAKDPAIQGSLDYAFPQGFAVGAWASNVDFDDDADIEVDLYGSYTGKVNESTSWEVGFNYYAYPGSDDVGDYPEYYVGLGAGLFSFKQWYSNNFYDLDTSAWYTEGNADIPLPGNFSLQLHAGYSWGDYWKDVGDEVFDYAVGLSYPVQNFTLSVKLTGTDASGAMKVRSDVGNNESRVILSVATTFPWGQ